MMLDDPDMRPYGALISPRLARSHVAAGVELLRRGKRGEDRSHLARAARLRPTMKALAGSTASWAAPSSLLSLL